MTGKRQTIRKRIAFFSFLFFPFTVFYFSPMVILSAGLSGILSGSALLFALQFLFSLFFGRAFCSWVCPSAGIHLCCSAVTAKKARNGTSRYIKYFLFFPWLAAVVVLLVRAGGISAVDPLYSTSGGMPLRSVEGYVVYFLVVLLMVVLSLVFGTRTFCHSLCWMAPFMVAGSKIKEALGYPSLRLLTRAERCTGCGQCTRKCPMGLKVEAMVKSGKLYNSECILCGECAHVCRSRAVGLGIGPGQREAVGKQHGQR